jgi:glycosyltransferase involved in cell wall biosynthesis
MKFDKNLVFICPGFAADEADSSCIPALQEFFRALLHQVPPEKIHIISLHYPFHRKVYSWNGISVYPCGGANRGGLFKPLTWLRARKIFRQINAIQKVDLVHSFWFSECCFVGQALCKPTGIPHVCTILGQEVLVKSRYEKRIDLSRVQLVAPTGYSKGLFMQQHPFAQCGIIPMGTEVSRFDGNQESARPIDILGVGSLISLKAFDVFVEAVSLILAEKKEIRAVILGDGPERQMLEQLIVTKGLSKHIVLRGTVSHPEVMETMLQSKVLLHPSHHETFGLVYAEAVHAGLGIVSRANGCYTPSKRWVLADDAVTFATQAMRLLDDFPFELGSYDFDIRTTIREYLACYQAMMLS